MSGPLADWEFCVIKYFQLANATIATVTMAMLGSKAFRTTWKPTDFQTRCEVVSRFLVLCVFS